MESLEDFLEKATHCPGPSEAIEALWDGDTHGWYVRLFLVHREDEPDGTWYRDFYLGDLCDEGEISASSTARCRRGRKPNGPRRSGGSCRAARCAVLFRVPGPPGE